MAQDGAEFTPRPVPQRAIDALEATGNELTAKRAERKDHLTQTLAAMIPADALAVIREARDGLYLRELQNELRPAILTELRGNSPRSMTAALTVTTEALARLRQSLTDRMQAVTAYAELDKLGGSVRVKCADDYHAQGMSVSAARTAASDHPVYMDHKAELARLSLAKLQADDNVLLALAELDVAKVHAEAFNVLARSLRAEPVLGGRG